MDTEFKRPLGSGFTIYTKSGCANCTNVKSFLLNKFFSFTIIDSDDYILENKEKFLSFIESIADTSYKTFPMVFYDGKFVGGFAHTVEFIDKLLVFEDNF